MLCGLRGETPGEPDDGPYSRGGWEAGGPEVALACRRQSIPGEDRPYLSCPPPNRGVSCPPMLPCVTLRPNLPASRAPVSLAHLSLNPGRSGFPSPEPGQAPFLSLLTGEDQAGHWGGGKVVRSLSLPSLQNGPPPVPRAPRGAARGTHGRPPFSSPAPENNPGVVSKVVDVCLRKEGDSFGFVVRGGAHEDEHKSRPLVVTHVRPGGPADSGPGPSPRCPPLPPPCLPQFPHLSNGFSLILPAAVEAGAEARGGLVTMETSPASRGPTLAAHRSGVPHPGDRIVSTAAERLRLEVLPEPRTRRPPFEAAWSSTPFSSPTVSLDCPRASTGRRRPRRTEHRSSVSLTPRSLGQLVRPETTEVVLGGGPPGGFGLHLQGGVFATEALCSPPLVSFLEPDSPAERCGLIQPGDRVLSINGLPTEAGTLEEARQLLREAALAGKVALEIGFDVADSVTPSSGTFHVKLPKRPGVELGITISCESAGLDLFPPPASREDGGRDSRGGGLPLRTPASVSLSSGRLNAYDLDSTGAVTYTVELKRFGGPLGITISGTEDPFDPIVISGLTKRGLAERTGAMHAGDRILAINGTSLKGRPLSEAIRLLQGSEVTVSLKIKKHPARGPARQERFRGARGEALADLDPRGRAELLGELQVTLRRDPVRRDFGFRVSDGLLRAGVHVHTLRPSDSVLQVGGVRARDSDCRLAASLQEEAGEAAGLVLSRDPPAPGSHPRPAPGPGRTRML
nr:glutamate receptor-interacting protein 2 [Microcebus murinus]